MVGPGFRHLLTASDEVASASLAPVCLSLTCPMCAWEHCAGLHNTSSHQPGSLA